MDLCESVLMSTYKEENPTVKEIKILTIPPPISPQNKTSEIFLKPISPHDAAADNFLKSPLCYYSENFRKHYEGAGKDNVEIRHNLVSDFETKIKQLRPEIIEDQSENVAKAVVEEKDSDVTMELEETENAPNTIGTETGILKLAEENIVTIEAPNEQNESPMAFDESIKYSIADSGNEMESGRNAGFIFSNSPPECIASASSTFQNQFTKGCKWSCDGTKLLTASDDNIMRVFTSMDSLDCEPALKIKEGEAVYDFSWLPGKNKFVSTGRYQPVHLWSADSGDLLASYRVYDQYDEVTHSFSVALNNTGDKIYCGLKNQVCVFDTSIPGRDCDVHVTSSKKEPSGQRGILSSIAVNSELPVYAVGSYNRSVGLYSTSRGNLLCLLQGQTGGITQVSFSHDGSRLYSGGRKDSEIICWDLRQPGEILYTVNRQANTNQRIQFDLSRCGRYLVSGGSDGCVLVWDVSRGGVSGALRPMAGYLLHPDCVNGVSLHPDLPLLATSAGQRHQDPVCSDSEDDDGGEVGADCSVKIWKF